MHFDNLEALGWTASLEASFAEDRSRGLEPGRVVARDRDLYHLACPAAGPGRPPERTDRALRAVLAGRMLHAAGSKEELPVVGDWVAAAIRPQEERATIHHLLPRRTALVRKAAGIETLPQVLAANVDVVYLVTSLNQDLNLRRIERTLSVIWESGAQPVLILNKADLSSDPFPLLAQARAVAIGVGVHAISALEGSGMGPFAIDLTVGRTAVLIGSSGVGKSTIINRLLGEDLLTVRELREHDGRGRHTTTRGELVALPGGGMLIDTPGLRVIGLWSDEKGFESVFPDIEALAARCRFRDCRHSTEPGCAVRVAVEGGDLDPDRLRSYQKLERELSFIARRQDQRSRIQEERLWRKRALEMRQRRRIEGR